MVSFTPQGLILPDPPTIVARNLLRDPFLLTRTWGVNGATGTPVHVPAGGPNGNGYFEFPMLTNNTASPMSIILIDLVPFTDTHIPVVPGETINVSAWWFRTNTGQVQRFDVNWYDAAGVTLSSSSGANEAIIQNDWMRADQDFVAPASAAYARPAIIWSGTYAGGTTLRAADAQVTRGAGVKPFTPYSITLDDGDLVDVNQLNTNLDRIADLAIGGQPLLSTDRPDFFSIDDATGRLIYETDTQGVYVRRNGNSSGAVGIGNVGANWRAVIPGTWRDWPNDNIWSSWLSGNNNTRRARIMPLGRLCFVHMEAVIGAGGSVSGNIGILTGLPFNTDMSSEAGYPLDGLDTGPWPVGDAMAIIGGSTYFGRIVQNSSSVVVRNIPTNNTSASNVWGATAPATWAVGDGITLDFCYYTT